MKFKKYKDSSVSQEKELIQEGFMMDSRVIKEVNSLLKALGYSAKVKSVQSGPIGQVIHRETKNNRQLPGILRGLYETVNLEIVLKKDRDLLVEFVYHNKLHNGKMEKKVNTYMFNGFDWAPK